jgi:hypothetical protein
LFAVLERATSLLNFLRGVEHLGLLVGTEWQLLLIILRGAKGHDNDRLLAVAEFHFLVQHERADAEFLNELAFAGFVDQIDPRKTDVSTIPRAGKTGCEWSRESAIRVWRFRLGRSGITAFTL